MDAVLNKPKRRSRFSIDPIILPDGSVDVISDRDLYPSDDRKFEILGRYDCLTVPYIAGLADEHPVAVHRRFNRLRAEPNYWVKLHDQQTENQRHYWLEPAVYQRSLRSTTRLKDKSFILNENEFTGQLEHRLSSCHVRADFDYGALKDPNIEIVPFHKILADTRLPEHTRKQPKPYLFPVSVQTKEGELINRTIRFDCHPFIINRKNLPKPYHLILGIEVDRGTERVKTLDYFKSYIRTKLIEDIALLESDLVRARFSFPSGYIIYVTESVTRLKDIMRELEHCQRQAEIA